MKFEVVRSRREIQAMTVSGPPTASAALEHAEAHEDKFRSILDSRGEWSYEVRPVE